MLSQIYRGYRFKFYLNASHYVIFNGTRGEVHPHTWEFSLEIRIRRDQLIIFNKIEKAVEAFLQQYQDKTMNDIPPFDEIIPTLENITDYFAEQLFDIIQRFQGILIRIEASETPSRSYIYEFPDQEEYRRRAEEAEKSEEKDVIGHIISRALS